MWRESNDWRGAGDVTIRPLLGLPGICGGRIIPRWARGQHAPCFLLVHSPDADAQANRYYVVAHGQDPQHPRGRHRHLRHLGRVQDLPPLREGEGDTTLCPIHPDRRAVQVVRRALRRVWSRRLRLLRRGRGTGVGQPPTALTEGTGARRKNLARDAKHLPATDGGNGARRDGRRSGRRLPKADLTNLGNTDDERMQGNKIILPQIEGKH